MKKILFFFNLIFLLISPNSYAQSITHHQNVFLPQLGKSSIDEILATMTIEEKSTLVIGYLSAMEKLDRKTMDYTALGFDYQGLGFPMPQVLRLGIPATIACDGSYGVKRYMPMKNGKWGVTAMPIPLLIASGWNVELAQEIAQAYGEEGKEYGIDVLLGPAMNIMRDPLCGRNFEYYSEDPLLSGKIAAAFIKGIQSNNVGTAIKHFAVNNQETNRLENDSRLTTRALREIYLRGFEIAVKEAHPWMIMTSYNKVNGIYTSENPELLKCIVRGEWGFDGVFMTDFNGLGWSPWQIAAGNDLIMPGNKFHVQHIMNAVNEGLLSIDDLDSCVKNMLNYIIKTNHFKQYKYTNNPDLKTHAEIARKAASEGFVLLKNEKTLPLTEVVKPALFGISSYKLITSGLGSGYVPSDYIINVIDGFSNSNEEVATFYTSYIKAKDVSKLPIHTIDIGGTLFDVEEPLPGDDILKAAASESDIAIITIGRNAGEGDDRKTDKGDWMLTDIEMELIKNVTKAFHAIGKKSIVLLNVNGPIETASWKNIPDAIMLVWLPGQEGGNAIADVLTGKVSPSGKLTSTFPVRYEDLPTFHNFPHNIVPAENPIEFDYEASMKNVYESGKNMRKEKPASEYIKNIDYTNYEEDIYVGYRYFDTFGKEVSYPFGYGLSYTMFSYSNLRVNKVNDRYEVCVEVKNMGSLPGKEIVQLYAISPENSDGRPIQELIAFAKTKTLGPNESEILAMNFIEKDLAWYDNNRTAWILEKGEYKIVCAASSRDARIDTKIHNKAEKIVEKTTDSVRPRYDLNILKP